MCLHRAFRVPGSLTVSRSAFTQPLPWGGVIVAFPPLSNRGTERCQSFPGTTQLLCREAGSLAGWGAGGCEVCGWPCRGPCRHWGICPSPLGLLIPIMRPGCGRR